MKYENYYTYSGDKFIFGFDLEGDYCAFDAIVPIQADLFAASKFKEVLTHQYSLYAFYNIFCIRNDSKIIDEFDLDFCEIK